MGSDGAVMCSDGLCLEGGIGGIGGWGEGMGGGGWGRIRDSQRHRKPQ